MSNHDTDHATDICGYGTGRCVTTVETTVPTTKQTSNNKGGLPMTGGIMGWELVAVIALSTIGGAIIGLAKRQNRREENRSK